MAARKKALVVVTSHGWLGDTGRPTGFYYDEMAVPYWGLVDAGYTVEIASILGGSAPFDPESIGTADNRVAEVDRFLNDPASVEKVTDTMPIAAIDPTAYTAIYLPGGHGTMWDFAESDQLARVVGAAYDNGSVIGSICHGAAGLLSAKRADGNALVAGLRVNAFTNAEESAVGLTSIVPYLLETRLRELGALFEDGPNFQAKAVRDRQLVTGQNPASAARLTEELLLALQERR